MMRLASAWLVVLSASMSAGAATAHEKSRPLVTGHEVRVDKAAQAVDFELTFASHPDFRSRDRLGRQHHSFQFFISTKPISQAAFYRGAQSRVRSRGLLLVRMETAGPRATIHVRRLEPFYRKGPWGPVVATVGYTVRGRSVHFEIPVKMLATAGSIYYYLEGYRYGVWDGQTLTGSTAPKHINPSVPLESAAADNNG